MDPTRFDQIAKHLATRPLTRRCSLAATAGAALAALTGGTRATRAQGTPAAPPAAGAGTAGQAANNATLFVQTARSGTFRPNPCRPWGVPAEADWPQRGDDRLLRPAPAPVRRGADEPVLHEYGLHARQPPQCRPGR